MNISLGTMFIIYVILVFNLNLNYCHGWDLMHIFRRYNAVKSPKVDNSHRFNLIFPGTKWCGAGNIASGYDDLGIYAKTDSCCRRHDFCKDFISSGSSKYGLKNDAFYTRLHCYCDHLFYQCLKQSNDIVSDNLGMIYFNILGTQCFQFEYPINKCLQYTGFRCVEYDLSESEDEIWQWFDVPIY